MIFKPLYLRGWTEEGIYYRKGQYQVKKPVGKQKNWLLRKVSGKPGKQVTEMEEDFTSLRDACKAGNQAIRKDDRAAKKLKNKNA